MAAASNDLTRAAAAQLAAAVGVVRLRNGRLEVDRLSRALRPHWRMVQLNGQWYDMESLRDATHVPATRRRLTPAELELLRNPAPWALADRRPINR